MIRQHQTRRRLAVVDLQGIDTTGTMPGRFTSRITPPNTPGTLDYTPVAAAAPVPLVTESAWPAWLTEGHWQGWAGAAASLIVVYEFARRRFSK